MSDDALIAWIDSGCKPVVSADEAAAKRAQSFSLRFVQALNPSDDLGATEELHQMCVAANVYEIHAELNRLGQDDYSSVWMTLSAPVRAAIKRYVAMHREVA